MELHAPRLETTLPDLHEFVRTLAGQVQGHVVRDTDTLVQRFRDFYTDGRMAEIERVLPGWQSMASYADGATLHHVTQALIALHLLPEYRQGSSLQQALLEWSVLCHDVGKQAIAGQRDAVHAFRSATMTARALAEVGFDTTGADAAEFEAWTRLVLDATVDAPDGKGKIQDNRELPRILDGLHRLFGPESPAALVVKTVLLHQSLTVVTEWPNPGSLTTEEQARCIGPTLLPLLEAMMLVDSDAWQLFDPLTKAKFRDCTLAVFDSLRALPR